MTHRYDLNGLRLETDLALPGVPEATWSRPQWRIAVVRGRTAREDAGIRWTGQVQDEERVWARFGRRGREAVVRLEGLCDLLVAREEGTARLEHDLDPSEEPYLFRHCMPYLIALQGGSLLALHAACLVLPAGAVLVCAPAGTGKSTLALAADAAGIPVLGDDHVAVGVRDDGSAVAYPAMPWLEVGGASRARFGEGPSVGQEGKRRTPCRTARPTAPVPVAEVCFLRRAASASRTPLRPAEAVPRLVRDVLFLGDPDDADEHARRLDTVARLLARVPVSELCVPEGLDALARDLPSLLSPWRAPRGAPAASGGRPLAR